MKLSSPLFVIPFLVVLVTHLAEAAEDEDELTALIRELAAEKRQIENEIDTGAPSKSYDHTMGVSIYWVTPTWSDDLPQLNVYILQTTDVYEKCRWNKCRVWMEVEEAPATLYPQPVRSYRIEVERHVNRNGHVSYYTFMKKLKPSMVYVLSVALDINGKMGPWSAKKSIETAAKVDAVRQKRVEIIDRLVRAVISK